SPCPWGRALAPAVHRNILPAGPLAPTLSHKGRGRRWCLCSRAMDGHVGASPGDPTMTSARIDGIVARLHGLHPRLIDLGLERLQALLEKLGHPERRLPPVI